jgi:hypothetical protein
MTTREGQGGGMRFITLAGGRLAKVDDEDHQRLSAYRWNERYSPDTRTFYAIRSAKGVNGKHTTVHMHREVMGLALHDPRKLDHRNGVTLDNRRENLRIATTSQNRINARVNRNSRLGVKGVSFVARLAATKPYLARIYLNKKFIYLGTFATLEGAVAARKEAEKKYHGEWVKPPQHMIYRAER